MIVSTSPLLALAVAATSLSFTSPAVPTGARLTPSSPTAEVGLTIGLEMRDRQVLDQLIARQHDPASVLYHHWITPQEFGERFGVSDATYHAIATRLAASGFHVDIYADRILIHALGTVAAAEKLLGVTFFDVTTGDSQYRTFRGTVRLPELLATHTLGISGLDTRPRYKHHLVDSFGDITMGPQDLRRFYDMAPLHALGITGQLSAVGIIGPIPDTADLPDPASLSWYYSNVSDSSVRFNIVNLGLQGSMADQQGDKDELELDAEMSTVAAPLEQSITMVLSPPDQLFIQGFAYFVNEMPDITAVSTSYGNCEAAQLQGETGSNANEHIIDANLIAQGTAEGIAFFAASGDNGTDDCMQASQGPSVDFPASIPYMTAVGGAQYAGTQLDMLNYVTNYNPGDETTWDDLPSNGAGGGGTSIIYAKPSYQIGIGNSAHFRDLPDIALVAAPNPGVAVDLEGPGILEPIGGTSDAAPMAAGIFALINDAIGGCRIGAPHFELYKLGVAQFDAGGTAVFHDITVGSISQDGIFPDAGAPVAKVGFDDATGWGSLDVTALANAWPICPATGIPSGPAFLADGGLPFDDAGLYDPTEFQPGAFDGGTNFDAGRGTYDPCEVIACDGGSVCVVSDAGGPAACVTFCTPSQSPTPCEPGTFCDSAIGACAFGCLAGTIPATCPANTTCLGPTDGGVGSCTQNCSPSAADAGCPTGSFCEPSTNTCGTGCNVNADCPSGDVCNVCFNRCIQEQDGGAIGAPCAGRSDCAMGELCLTEAQGGGPNGYCTAICGAGPGGGPVCDCPGTSICLTAFGICMPPCIVGEDSTCQFGNVCDAIGNGSSPGSPGGCLPKCTEDSDCNTDPNQTSCNTTTGDCVIPGSSSSSSSSSSVSGSTGTSGSSGTASTGATSSSSSGRSSTTSSASTSGSSGPGSSSSSGSVASTASSSTGITGTSGATGSTGLSNSAAATTSSTSGGSSSAKVKSGCGCTGASGSESAIGLLLGVGAMARRRRGR